MHGVRSTIILLVVLAGLGGYIYFVDAKRDPNAGDEKPKVFTVSPENINEVQISQVTGDTAHVQRVDANWMLIAPEKAEADPAAVASFTSSLAGLEEGRVIEENATDLAQYGLNPPRLEVAFKATGQPDFQRILIGEKTPTGGDLYAKRAESNQVFLIPAYLDATFTKTAFDLRDKTILKFDSATVSAMDLTIGPDNVQLTKNGAEWMMARPWAARADYATIESLITSLASARMQKIVAEEASNLKQYGLDKPAITATLSSGSSRATLLVGTGGDGGVYAKDASRPLVFTVDEMLAMSLRKQPKEFRRKDLVDARSFTATHLELARGGETFVFDKTTADGKDTWKNGSGATVDTAKVEELLTQISNLRPTDFVTTAPPMLNTPVFTANLRFDGGKTESIAVARMGDEAYGSRPDDPGAARLDPTTVDAIMKALDALK